MRTPARRTLVGGLGYGIALGVSLACLLHPDRAFGQGMTDGELPSWVFAAIPGDDAQDVVFFTPSRPVILRYQVQIRGVPFRSSWSAFVQRLHDYLDGDGDGTLTIKEASRGDWQQQLLHDPFRGAQRNNLLTRLSTVTLDSGPKDEVVSLAELEAYLRLSLGFGEFEVQLADSPDTRTAAAFGWIDTDGDGRLSAVEVDAVDTLVARLDRDGDELVGLDELRPYSTASTNRFFVAVQPPEPADPGTAAVVALSNPRARSRVMRRLLIEYDHHGTGGKTRKDRHLDREELGLPETVFLDADDDGDGRLDPLEIEGWLADPEPDIVVVATLGNSAGAGPGLEISLNAPGLTEVPLDQESSGSRSVTLEGLRVDLAADRQAQDVGMNLRSQFQGADSDKNGYIDPAEASANYYVQQLYGTADRDHDDMLFEAEWNTYAEQLGDALTSRVVLTVIDLGRDLYSSLDADRNRTLGLRELRESRPRVAGLDVDQDGTIEESEITRRFELTLSRGSRPTNQGVVFQSYGARPSSAPSTAKAPFWFRRMDRNRDGDISRREWLGPLDAFHRFDTDGDDLIDAREASTPPAS